MRHTAHGWWLEEAGPSTACPPLESDTWADVAVIGGGFTGLWAAWQVLERSPGARVVLVEAGLCGEGPSGRNGGFADHLALAAPRLRALAGDDVARRTIEASIDAVRAIGRWCAEEEIDAWFHPGGQLVASAAAAQDGASHDAVAACRALGLIDVVRVITPEEVRLRCAAEPLRGGLMVAHTATVQPARLARGLRSRLLGRGVAIHEHTRVTGLHDEPGGVRVRTDSGATLRAGAAVLATGAWSAALGPFRRSLTVTSSHIVLTEPVPDVLEDLGWTHHEAITDERRLVHYFRTTRDDRILFGWGGGRIACGGRIGPREHVDPAVTQQVIADLHRFFPALRDREVTHAWGGPIDASPNHLPAVRTLAGGRTHAAFGYTGNGVGPSRLCGDLLAAMALDQRDEVTRVALVEPSVRGLPPEPLRLAGGSAIRRAIDTVERAGEEGRPAPLPARAVAALPRLLGVHIGR